MPVSLLLAHTLTDRMRVDPGAARRLGERFAPDLPPEASAHIADLTTLWSAPLGVPCVLAGWSSSNARREETLSALGLHAGASLTVRRRRPTLVLRAGETEIALERRVAEELWVVPLG
jgi:Fe2+ transport system protein FeoA